MISEKFEIKNTGFNSIILAWVFNKGNYTKVPNLSQVLIFSLQQFD